MFVDFCFEKMFVGFKEVGEFFDDLFDFYIKLYNDCFSECLDDFYVGIYFCCGNFVYLIYFFEGGYDCVVKKFFNEFNVDIYYFEYDIECVGGFEFFVEFFVYKNVIVGLVISKFFELENVEEMKERVLKVVEFVVKGVGEGVMREDVLKRMGVSLQCGFVSYYLGNKLGREDMVKKLKLVREIVDFIWLGEFQESMCW